MKKTKEVYIPNWDDENVEFVKPNAPKKKVPLKHRVRTAPKNDRTTELNDNKEI
jgi:hypothetical protein